MTDDMNPVARPSRTEEVLAPAFLDGIDEIPVEDLRRRRDLATRERDFQSYLRRLVQTPCDLLVAERERRTHGAAPTPIVERLKAALADAPRGSSRGEAVRVTLTADDLEEARARADALVSASQITRAQKLSDEELEAAIERLQRAERLVSRARHAVFDVHDRLQDELKRRYSTDPSLIPTRLS